MPDILVFAALPAKLRGARVIIDLHDPMPELMTAIYNLRPEHGMVRMLRRFERWSLAFADLAFTPNITFKRLFVSRGCPEAKMQIIMNSPQQSVFDPDRFAPGDVQHKRNGVFRVMHHGSIVHRHGVDLLVEAVASLRNSIPGIRLDIYGSRTSFLDVVLDTAKRAGAADIVHFHGEKSLPEIAAAIRECDLGVVPNRRSAFTETNFPTRLFEYLAMQRPVLAPSTEGIRDYFQETDMLYFDPDAPQTLAERIAWAYNHRDALNDFVARGAAVYRRHLWREEKQRLVNMTQELLHR
jgi:glycosyltransferase involved in cell wall biosynthesis